MNPKKNIIKSRPGLYAVIILSIFLVSQCKSKEETAIKEPPAIVQEDLVELTDAQFQNAPVETTELSIKNISTTLKLNGTIDVPPQNLVSVSIPLGGYLKSTELLPGVKVRRGETIAWIENPHFIQLQQDYLIAKSKFQYAETDYNRQKQLNESKASSDKTLQQAQAEMNAQHIMMDALAQQLKLINIDPANLRSDNIQKSVPVYSSINGFVSKVNVNIGKYVNPTEILFELIDPTDIHLHLKVYEKDLGFLKIGQRLISYTNTDPQKKYGGEIILISRDVSESGVTEVHCHFDKYEPELIPGMYMNAEVETETSFANALPEECIVHFEGKDYVFAEEKKQTYRFMPVIPGESENGFIKILNSQDFTGKKIVTKNAYTLLMKLKNTAGEEE